METVTTKDGTTIAFDRLGHGPPVILISGGPTDRFANAPLAELLAPHFTVVNFDRRGRGQSGDTPPYAVEREIEDVEALLGQVGGSAAVYGTSGGGVFALRAAASGLPITAAVAWEPPFVVDGSRPPVPSDYKAELIAMIDAGRRGDAIEYFMTEIVGLPAEFVAPMRQAPFWSSMAALAHAIVYEADVMGDYSLPGWLPSVAAPTLVLEGGTTPWLTNAARAVAEALPNAERRTLEGQPHNVDPQALAPALVEFLSRAGSSS